MINEINDTLWTITLSVGHSLLRLGRVASCNLSAARCRSQSEEVHLGRKAWTTLIKGEQEKQTVESFIFLWIKSAQCSSHTPNKAVPFKLMQYLYSVQVIVKLAMSTQYIPPLASEHITTKPEKWKRTQIHSISSDAYFISIYYN